MSLIIEINRTDRKGDEGICNRCSINTIFKLRCCDKYLCMNCYRDDVKNDVFRCSLCNEYLAYYLKGIEKIT